MKRSNKTRFALLGMLTQHPMSGYDIKKEMDESTQYFWQESPGQIYPILAELLKEKSVSCVQSKTGGARVRNIYKITAKGRQELKEWLEKEVIDYPSRNELLLKLFFGKNNSHDLNRQHVKAHQLQLSKGLKKLAEISKMLKNEKSEHVPYWMMTVRYGEYVMRAQLQWCEEVLQSIKKVEKSSER